MTPDDAQLLMHFESRTLPKSQWAHATHVKVAYLYVSQYPFDQAVVKMRSGIQALNASHGTVDSATTGYHETVTLAWLRLVHAHVPGTQPLPSADAFLQAHPPLQDSRALSQFYSRERLGSALARSQFVEPDLAKLP